MKRRLFSLLLAVSLFVFQSMHAAQESFLLLNGVTDEVFCEIGPHIDERISPCSTFKIPLSLMGYDAGILQDENNPTWDFQEGYDDFLEFWKAPQTPTSWMQYSCIWYSKLLGLELGVEKIQSYLAALEYGNQDISGGLPTPGRINPAWIQSSLKISPREQVAFIQKMVQRKLPLSQLAMDWTQVLLFKEQLPNGWDLYGKTGWGGSTIARDGHSLEHAWFVGWIEKEVLFFPFAYQIREQKIQLEQRIPRVKQLLMESGVLD